jgi:hypothetical protein|tara:strand:+ start:6290 stop:6679 length:390 start_codon:yes stop_codon:yes gene_type:complete
MDLELKYIEDKLSYEIDEWFFSQLELFSIPDATVIIGQILSILDELPEKDEWSQEVAGVVHKESPVFFVIEYLKETVSIPILIDINEIEVDEYLDFISSQKSIKYYYNERRNKYPNEKTRGVQLFENNN